MLSSTVNPIVFESYPDRGLQAYSVVLGAWLALFPASGLLNSTGIFQAWLVVNQLDKYSEPQIAWIFSTFAFLFFFGGIQAGPIFDRYGPKYLFPTGACGLVVALLSSVPLLKTRLPANPTSRVLLDWKGFKDTRFTLTMMAIFILDWAVLVPPAYITTYTSSHGLSDLSPNILAILNSASTLGRCLPGIVADRVGRFNVMIICATLSTLSIFCLWLQAESNAAVVISFAVTYGFFSGTAFSLTPVCVAQLCKTEEYATRYGTAYGVVSFATLAGVPLSGLVLGTSDGNHYTALVLFCGTAYAVSALLFICARGISKDWRLLSIF
ncbi:MFS monocarboxylate transporter [Fusarium sp. NRRL 25303]|nr:MFS monocarboxylate transporter [Fusarium sp. NRRL 25303]